MFKPKQNEERVEVEETVDAMEVLDENPTDIETIVGPSVEVEGDFSSKGNMVVQGTVAGNVKTAKNLRVEKGAKILANVQAQNAKISGSIQGNVKIKNTLELTSTAVVVGDVNAAVLIIAGGAIMHGKCTMPGEHVAKAKAAKAAKSTSRARSRTRQTTASASAQAAA